MASIQRVYQQLNRYLHENDDNVPDSIKSFARLQIYQTAVRILSLPFDKRAAAIERYGRPVELRAEIIRVFEYRRRNR